MALISAYSTILDELPFEPDTLSFLPKRGNGGTGSGYARHHTIVPFSPELPLPENEISRFTTHTAGLYNFILQLGLRAEGHMTAHIWSILRHIRATKHYYLFDRPLLDENTLTRSEISTRFAKEFHTWGTEANAIFLIGNSSLVLPDGTDLLATNASAPILPEAWQRARRIRALLADQGIIIPDSVPPAPSIREIMLRSAQDVAQLRKEFRSLAALSDDEQTSATHVLSWALHGENDDARLPEPPQLRPVEEIADALERARCIRWFSIEHPHWENPKAIAGRYRALVWLTTPLEDWAQVDISV